MVGTKPLAGLKVADFSMVYAGPICARMLSDNGAEVTKIEPLGMGDTVRANSRIFSHFNAGKKSIQIDLSDSRGQSLAHGLIDDADIVIENYRPGVMARFGLDYAAVKERCPKLVYCSISGFGQTGPDSQRAAYAPIAHAASGYDISHMRAQQDGNPRPAASGIMIADMLTGAYAFGAIQTALLGRVSSGLGDHIDITMAESTMMLIPGQQQMAQVADPPQVGGFQPVATSDGFVMLCIVSEKNFDGLCSAIERADMREDERFARGKRFLNMGEFVAEIEIWSSQRTIAECEAILNQHGVPCSRFNAPEELFAQPQLQHRGAFQTLRDDDGDYLIQNVPFQFESFDNSTAQQAPSPGEHTDWVLQHQLNMEPANIAQLRETGIVE
ncbi:MAG: CoA transferase [Pseudomonadales bacterium]|nr:CoA transferase [Pseudomonadales bacterium]